MTRKPETSKRLVKQGKLIIPELPTAASPQPIAIDLNPQLGYFYGLCNLREFRA
jgi:hypothetical protein